MLSHTSKCSVWLSAGNPADISLLWRPHNAIRQPTEKGKNETVNKLYEQALHSFTPCYLMSMKLHIALTIHTAIPSRQGRAPS
jgi:hypothetical protein